MSPPPTPARTIVTSPVASFRLDAARRFLSDISPVTEVLLVGETRESADELARERLRDQPALFGLHRFSLRQLAYRLASAELARQGLAPATGLGAEAVAARAAFEERSNDTLEYLAPITRLRSIGRTLASTLGDVRHAGLDARLLGELGPGGADLEALSRRYASQLEQAGLVDPATLYRTAAEMVGRGVEGVPTGGPVLLLDTAVVDETTFALVRAIAEHASRLLITVPAGDERTLAALNRLPNAEWVGDDAAGDDALDPLDRVRHYLFATEDPPVGPDGSDDVRSEPPSVDFFSAPGEGRECVEIVRTIVEEARRGIPLDRMAILLRSPQLYAGLLETALRRAGVDAWFVRGTRAPDPAGRAFLALLACGAEGLSARRFSEYLSLGQVPRLDHDGGPPRDRHVWTPPAQAETALPAPAVPVQLSLLGDAAADTETPESQDDDTQPVAAATLRAPRQWDRLLVESAVIGGHQRWVRRLDGLAAELRLRRDEIASEEPDSARVGALDRDLQNLAHLRRFALPVIETLAALPGGGSWGEWLDALETLAPMVLDRPERVLAVLGELRPMARVGPMPPGEVQDVLSERLTELQQEPPRSRYGRVFVGRPEQVRGRTFDVVFLPGLAERIFPQKQRQDPLLLDDARVALNAARRPEDGLGLQTQPDRGTAERLLLRLAVGAATRRLHLSYPRMQLNEARPRVASFYALDIERARTGGLPHFRVVERRASRTAGARLAWPAPSDPTAAIDDIEHDLAVLGPLLRPDAGATHDTRAAFRGRARYLLKLNPALHRSLTARWARWQKRPDQRRSPWSKYDGLYDVGDVSRSALSAYRLSAKPYSVSALQRFAMCPYQFLLTAIYRLRPREEVEPLEQLDPLTRGRLFHEVQAELVRALRARDALPVTRARLEGVEQALDETLNRVAAAYHETLAPAIERVWLDEIESIRGDLKGWVHHVAEEEGEWIPMLTEYGFGFAPGHGRDPASVREPVTLDGKWLLHGVVDLIEAKAGPTPKGELRVTDHKTGRNRTRERIVVGHGEVLQPVLYGLAVEQTLGRPVGASRLFFCTVKGQYTTRPVELGERERRAGLEVLEIIDRAIEAGELLPAPRAGACRWCDFLDVCGPWEETRSARKDETKLIDLDALRRMP